MSDAKHTKGPWSVTKCKHGIDGASYCVAVIAADRGDRSLIVHAAIGGDDDAEANARLIAAAPDLLAACKAALESIPHAHDMARRPIVAAIAKAEGRT